MSHLSVAGMLAIVGALAYIVVGGGLEVAGAVAVSLVLMAYRRRRAKRFGRPDQRASPAFAGIERFTTVTVTREGYCFEWCTALWATTPFASS